MESFIRKFVLIFGLILLAACANIVNLDNDANTTLNSEASASTALPAAPGIKDDEECLVGNDCSCGNVVCSLGCTCEMTGPTGICTSCPAPEVPTIAIDTQEVEIPTEAIGH